MKRNTLFVLSAVAAMSASAVAIAGEIDSPREAQVAINAMTAENASLTKAVQAAEQKTSGKAFRVELTSHDDVSEMYANATRQPKRTVNNQDGKDNDPNGTNDKAIDRDAPHATVHCLVDGKRIRCALVNLKSGEVVRVRNIGHGNATVHSQSHYNNRGSDYDRSYASDRQNQYGDQRSRADRGYIEQNAWPPKPGDRYYDEYADARNNDGYNSRTRSRNVSYDGEPQDRYDDRSSGRSDGRYGNRDSDRYNDRFDQRGQSGTLYRSEGRLVLASDLMNANVRNNRNQDLGGIENLAIDPNSSCLVYASLTHGGILGLGQKHFAIPPQELTLGGDGNVYLDVERQELQNRDGFDAGKWPMQADSSFSSSGMQYDGDVSKKQQPAAQRIVKASKIIGHKLVDGSGEKLGEIDDLVVDPSRGKVAYLVVEVDDDLWEHELVVIPTGVVQMGDDKCVVNVATATFQSMPTFSDDDYPNWNDQEWNRRVHARFNVAPYWDDDQG